jgi:hypothetical protein
MKGRDFTISLIIALIYWIPASIDLLEMHRGSEMIFPVWLDIILIPGNVLGFGFGFFGGYIWETIGQFVELIIIFFIARMIYEPFRRKIFKDDEE